MKILERAFKKRLNVDRSFTVNVLEPKKQYSTYIFTKHQTEYCMHPLNTQWSLPERFRMSDKTLSLKTNLCSVTSKREKKTEFVQWLNEAASMHSWHIFHWKSYMRKYNAPLAEWQWNVYCVTWTWNFVCKTFSSAWQDIHVFSFCLYLKDIKGKSS